MSTDNDLNKNLNNLVWGKQNIIDNEIHSYYFGPTKIFVKKTSNEIWIAHSLNKENIDNTDLDWSRWGYKDKDLEIKISPILPDRALVVKPENPLRLLSNTSAKVYVRVPVWAKIELVSKKESATIEIPSLVLSNTWFGDFVSGQLCYWLSSSTKRELILDNSKKHLVTCPINIINKSTSDLLIQKLRLQVDLLSIYKHEDSLLTNESLISYKGENTHSQVEITNIIPNEIKKSDLLSQPRKVGRRKGIGRTFGNVFDLTNLGFN